VKTVWIIGASLILFSLFGDRSFGAAVAKEKAAKATEIFQADITELKIPADGLTAVQGRIGNVTIPFYPSGGDYFTTLVGVDLEAKPGLVNVIIKGTTTSATLRESQVRLQIKAKSFKQESFSVAAEFDQLSAAVIERIRKDQDQFSRAFMSSAPERLWEGSFLLPVSSDITSPFGYRRVINKAPRAPHTGVDLKAALGTEVMAANHGRVVLLGDFFFSGQSLVLDHGGGLYTMYFHLSAFKVGIGASGVGKDILDRASPRIPTTSARPAKNRRIPSCWITWRWSFNRTVGMSSTWCG